MVRLVRFARTSPALSKPRLHKGRSFNLKLQTRGHRKEGESNGQPKSALRKVRRSIGQYDERQLRADSFEMRHWMDIEGEREQEVEKDRDIDRGPGHSH